MSFCLRHTWIRYDIKTARADSHEYETERETEWWTREGEGEGEGLMMGQMDEVLKKACAVCYCCLRRYKWQRSTGLETRLNRT